MPSDVTSEDADLLKLVRMRRALQTGEAADIRQRAGLAQAELAAAIPVSRSAVGLWEQGRRVPRGAAARRYADVLDILSRCGGDLSPPGLTQAPRERRNTSAVTPETLGGEAR